MMQPKDETAYSPELGQAIFGAPWGDFDVPPIGEAVLRMILDEVDRVYGNRYGRSPDGPHFGGNDGFELPAGALGPELTYRAYYWGDDPIELKKPNFAFRGVELRWYKHSLRGLSANKELSPDEWSTWLKECLEYLHALEPNY